MIHFSALSLSCILREREGDKSIYYDLNHTKRDETLLKKKLSAIKKKEKKT